MTEAAATVGHTSARHNSLEKPLTPWGHRLGQPRRSGRPHTLQGGNGGWPWSEIRTKGGGRKVWVYRRAGSAAAVCCSHTNGVLKPPATPLALGDGSGVELPPEQPRSGLFGHCGLARKQRRGAGHLRDPPGTSEHPGWPQMFPL